MVCTAWHFMVVLHCIIDTGGVAEWLRDSAPNLVRSIRVGSNPVVGTTNHKPTANSTVHPSEVSK